ncbi:MAG TPA: GDSL-type esterase/lipase family protein, partial [Burkholderiales bacterium]
MGDSITLGVNGGYRNNLYTGLQQNNCGVSYVGTLNDPNTQVADKDHDGHAGFAIGDIANSVTAWLGSTQPNIVLLMIGTNDTAWWTNNDAAEIGARHDALVDQIMAARPNAWIFVA